MKTITLIASALTMALGINVAFADVSGPMTLCNKDGFCQLAPAGGQFTGLCKGEFCTISATQKAPSAPIELCTPSGFCKEVPVSSNGGQYLRSLCNNQSFCRLTLAGAQ